MTAGTGVETAHPEPLCRPAPLRGVDAARAPRPDVHRFRRAKKNPPSSDGGFPWRV